VADAIAAWFAGCLIQFWNGVSFDIWLFGRKLLGIVLCMGPWVLTTELPDRTRGYVDQWVGIIVGLIVFQLAAAIELQLMLHSQSAMLMKVRGSIDSVSIDEAVGTLFHLATMMFMDALTMLALPMVCGIGSGAAAAHGYAMALIAAAPLRVAKAGVTSGARGARLLSGAAGRSSRNAIAMATP
jgi:hypothetical protein